MSFFSRPSSSAVKIVAPSASHSEPSSPKAPRKDSTQRQCRNILIYGSCKFQDKGCIYYHPPRDSSSPVPPDSPTPSAALPAQAVNAPVFVPKNPASPVPAPAVASTSHVPTFTPSAASPEYHYDETDTYDPQGPMSDANVDQEALDNLAEHFQALDPSVNMNPYDQMGDMDYDAAMDPFYQSQSAFTRQPLNYHLYTHPRPEALQQRYFISDNVREELQRRSEALYASPAPGLNLPEETQGYHSLMPLESTAGERRKFGNWYSAVYKAVNSQDGVAYALRRIENYRLNSQAAFSSIESWARIKHPSLISVKEAFTTRAFNDNSLVVVYDYHPNAETMFEAHIKAKAPQFQNGRLQAQSNRIPERTLWSYIIQIASAIKTVHDAGLAVRVVDPTKVLVTGKNRVRISSCGIVDVLMYEARQDIAMLQQEDLVMFGRLILSLCCSNLGAVNNPQKSLENVGRNYPQEIRNIIVYLMQKPNPLKTIRQVCDMTKSQMLQELDESLNAADRLEGELMSELENGRLVRLLCKFGFIDERPEFARDPRWSETGDRYIVKLFRDYVFHQVDQNGQPVVNLSHVLTCLNKLDAGVDERIMLVSRDEQSCLVVSYREIKSCMESAFSELSGR
ncbi:PAB-dependent poly(A)-specific ribonuclease subunit PAN3 [Phanerochaete sordida]|uniref:PAN2-PAN3 deadenylation complex subunit PAN3 n=1 Tax=Phanerochaete sordida TaxID=48140 RepID=A0A9P3LGC2_9APHY|nr:PAB-dependent poly(A)-specific ribonuclease subunit PAN3 [Phanerochaete sordida]